MKRASLALLFSLLACGDDGSNKKDDPTTPEWEGDPRFADLAAAVEIDLRRSAATGASVAVWLDGEIIYVGGFGVADPLGDTPPGESTLFMIGSDTKKITALSLLRKVAAGTLSLDDELGALLPDLDMALADDFETARVRDLISHQGGIVDGVEDTMVAEDSGLAAFAYGTFADEFYEMAPPGRIWNYSNPNFSIAGLVDETVDGRPWADIVEQDLFAPLGMTRTFARKSELDADVSVGRGYQGQNDPNIGRVSLEGTWESAFTRPAGLVWSTPTDQMRLAAFIVDGDESILPAAQRAELYAPQVPTYPDLPGNYGFGLFNGQGLYLGGPANYYDLPVWSHGGNTLTHTSTFYILPEQHFAISILSNGVGDDFVGSVVTAMSTLVTLPEKAVPPTPPFEISELDGLAGTYVDAFNAGTLIITHDDGAVLGIDAPDLDAALVPYQHTMDPTSTRVWTWNVQNTDLDFAFIDGPDGEMYFRNRAVVAIRPPSSLRSVPVSVHPSREAIEAALRLAAREKMPALLRPN